VGLGLLNTRRTARVKRVDVPIANLPAALHGFTIAQISDLHVGPTIRAAYVQRIVDRVNGLEADAVAITGDIVDGPVQELRTHVAPLGNLRSRHGTFFVTGNHEYYAGAGPWLAEVRGLGIRVLMNEHVVLERDGASLVLAGVADYTAHHFDERTAAIRPPHWRARRAAPAPRCCSRTSRAVPRRPPKPASTCRSPATPTAASSSPGSSSCASSSRSRPGCTGWAAVGLRQPWHGLLGPTEEVGAPSEITRLRLVAG
jgi:hypothetical protein